MKVITAARDLIMRNIDGQINIDNVAKAIVKINPDFDESQVIKDLEAISQASVDITASYKKNCKSSKEMIENEILSKLDSVEAKTERLETVYYILDPEAKDNEEKVSQFASLSLAEKIQLVADEIDRVSGNIAGEIVDRMDFDKAEQALAGGLEPKSESEMLLDAAAVYYVQKSGYGQPFPLGADPSHVIGMALGARKIIERETIRILSKEEEKQLIKLAIVEVIENVFFDVILGVIAGLFLKGAIEIFAALMIAGSPIIIFLINVFLFAFCGFMFLSCILCIFGIWLGNNDSIKELIENSRNKKKYRKAQAEATEENSDEEETDEENSDEEGTDEENSDEEENDEENSDEEENNE